MTTQAAAIPIASARRPSPFSALLWKEWRQQRWVFLLLLGATFVAMVAVGLFVREGVVIPAFIGSLIVPVILGANAFCMEEDDGTTAFLQLLPARWRTVFLLKSALLSGLIFATLGLCFACVLLANWGGRERLSDLTDAGLLAFACFAWLLAFVPGIVAVVAPRTISCIIASITATGIATAWIVLWHEGNWGGAVFYIFRDRGDRLPFLPIYLFPLLLIPLAAGWLWCWSRRERPLVRRVWRLGFVAGLFLIVPPVILALRWVQFTFVTPPSAVAGYTPIIWTEDWQPSPDGRHVICYASSPLWRVGDRAFVLDMTTSKAQWLGSFRHSNSALGVSPGLGRGRTWSPSGRRCIIIETNYPLWPFDDANWRGLVNLEQQAPLERHYLLFDVEKGNKSPLFEKGREGGTGYPALEDPNFICVGWLDEGTCIFSRPGLVVFLNVDSGTYSQCRESQKSSEWLPLLTARGVFCQAETPWDDPFAYKAVVMRFAPDLQSAESITLGAVSHAIGPLRLANVSPDGRWLLFDADGERASGVWLARAENGASLTLLTSEIAESQPLQPGYEARSFTPDGRSVLLCSEGKLALMDLSTNVLTSFPMKCMHIHGIERTQVTISPSGRYAELRTTNAKDGIRQRAVTDLRNGDTWSIWDDLDISPYGLTWLNDNQLLAMTSKGLYIIRRDGSGSEPLKLKD